MLHEIHRYEIFTLNLKTYYIYYIDIIVLVSSPIYFSIFFLFLCFLFFWCFIHILFGVNGYHKPLEVFISPAPYYIFFSFLLCFIIFMRASEYTTCYMYYWKASYYDVAVSICVCSVYVFKCMCLLVWQVYIIVWVEVFCTVTIRLKKSSFRKIQHILVYCISCI